MRLDDIVWLLEDDRMIETTWGIVLKYAYEYTENARVFGGSTEEEIWEMLDELHVKPVLEDEFCDWVEDEGSMDDLIHWVFSPDKNDDTIYELSNREWELL